MKSWVLRAWKCGCIIVFSNGQSAAIPSQPGEYPVVADVRTFVAKRLILLFPTHRSPALALCDGDNNQPNSRLPTLRQASLYPIYYPTMDAKLPPKNIRAILFDLDGTLIDSEKITDRAVAELLAQQQIEDPDLDFLQFHGINWKHLEKLLKDRFPSLADVAVLGFLERRFYEISTAEPPPLLPGARAAFLAASAQVPTAIVTGSGAVDVEAFLDRANLRTACSFYLSYEMYSPSKPAPNGYRIAAERLHTPPEQCLVFEDSQPGLTAARTAGMPTVAITYSSPQPPPGLADQIIEDYTHLPTDFFAAITT